MGHPEDRAAWGHGIRGDKDPRGWGSLGLGDAGYMGTMGTRRPGVHRESQSRAPAGLWVGGPESRGQTRGRRMGFPFPTPRGN